jgi:hypothetical protein
MTIDDVMKLDDEELTLKVAEIQGHKNLEWMSKPFDELGRMLVDTDTHKAILSPVDNIVAAWNLWCEMNYSEPCQWAIFGDSDGDITIEYFGWDYKGDRREGSGLWSIEGPDTLTITRAYIVSRTME